MVARDGRYLGTIVIGDTIRPGTRQALAALNRMSIRTLLLTGDSEFNAAATARQLGISQFEADLLPEAKLARIRELVDRGQVVAMVGDGINDAPALAAASVGVAMGSGTEVARESGHVLLLGNDLARLAQTIEIGRWTRRIIRQNFVGTIVVDVSGMALAACGLINPTLAAFIHVASELTFILNSARLLPRFQGAAPERAHSISSRSDSIAKAA
jgi:P-type E1-E2 ATPase